jgi:tetratricopeptide (TPR) repeat protein
MDDDPLDLDDALEEATRALATDPALALERADRLATKMPDARTFRLVAAAHRALGHEEEAAEAELQGIKFGFTPPLRRAVAAKDARRFQDSKAIAEEYLRQYPDDLLAMTIAAEAALLLQDTRPAQDMLRRVLVRAPGFPRAAVLLANSLVAELRLREAIAVVEQLRQHVPDDLTALRYLADLRAQSGDYGDAAEIYAAIPSVEPPNAGDLFKQAQNLRAAGRRAEALDVLRTAIDLSPHEGAAWWALAQYFPEQLDGQQVERLQQALASGRATASDAGLLRIALSIAFDRRGEHEAAFREISSVKAARRASKPYDPDALTRHVDALIAGFTPEFVSARECVPSSGETPIFVVGMPRSGSTLVERILGRHSLIEATGEIQVMPRLVDAERANAPAAFQSLLPASLSPGKTQELAGRYLEGTRQFRRAGKPFFVDKYNANWIHAGLIRLMFPDAKILDVRRSALDCCWSVYKMMFGDAYANDQRHLARYYADYVRFMEAIDAAAPGGILTVSYESLVEDLESHVGRMLEFIGVDYEKQCAGFHLSSDPVATPSSEQVRRPLFRDSIGSAEPYRQWLGPLVEELDRLNIR